MSTGAREKMLVKSLERIDTLLFHNDQARALRMLTDYFCARWILSRYVSADLIVTSFGSFALHR
jgi:hypothetical protein